MRVVGVAATSAQALRRAAELQPDAVLVDIALGGESGFDVAQSLAGYGDGNAAPVVILMSTYSEADFADLMAQSVATGFLPKQELSAHAVRQIVDGRARRLAGWEPDVKGRSESGWAGDRDHSAQ